MMRITVDLAGVLQDPRVNFNGVEGVLASMSRTLDFSGTYTEIKIGFTLPKIRDIPLLNNNFIHSVIKET